MFLQVRSESFARSGWADVKWIRNNTNNNNSNITTITANQQYEHEHENKNIKQMYDDIADT